MNRKPRGCANHNEKQSADIDTLTDILGALSHPVFALDKDLRICYANRAAEQLTASGSPDLRGRSVGELTETPVDVHAALSRCMSQQVSIVIPEVVLVTGAFDIHADPSPQGIVVTMRPRASAGGEADVPRSPADPIQLVAAGAGALLWYADVTESESGDLDWRIHGSNEETAQRLFPVSMRQGQSHLDAFHEAMFEEDTARVRAHMAREIRMGRDHTDEFRYRRQDGRIRWVSTNVSVIADGPGRWCVNGITTDVSERKEAEERLRTSEMRFRQAFDMAPIGMVLATPDYRVIETNHAFCEMLGYTAEELTGMSLTDLTHPDDRESSKLKAGQVFRREIGTYTLQKRYRARSGEYICVNLTVALVPDTAGQPRYTMGMIENLTERKRTEEHRSLLASIVESSIDPVVAVSLGATIISWNSAAERMYGYSRDEALGKHLTMLAHPDRRAAAMELHERVLRGESPEIVESVSQHKDGHCIDVMIRASPIKNSDGTIVGGATTIHDTTHRKQTQRVLDLQVARLSALRAIDKAIIGTIDLRLAAEEIVQQICATLGVHAADLFVLNQGKSTLDHVASGGFRVPAAARASIRVGEGISGKAVLTREPILIPVLADADRRLARTELQQTEGFVGYAAIPLVAKGQVAGVLEVFHREALNLSSDQWDFLNDLAAQAAIAIDNARMFERLQRSNLELTLAYDATIEGWSHAMDLRDHDTEGHSLRVTDLTLRIAQELGVPAEQMIHVRRGALLHDIGKMGIPDSVLLKPGPLDEAEWEIMRKHPVYAFEMLAPIDFLRPASEIPYCHHEKWDGTGYPRGLKGEQIPLAARIFAVVDVWDALRSDRPYRPAWSSERATEWIAKSAGTHFDPQVAKTFVRLDLTQF